MSTRPDLDNAIATELLPASLTKLLDAVQVLEDAASQTAFPNLASTPATSEQVEQAVQEAADWANVVRRAYGVAQRARMYRGTGILPFFNPRSGFDANLDAPELLLGELPAEFGVKELYSRELFFFEHTFSKAGELVLGSGRSLREPGGRGVALTTANWVEIRRQLAQGYGMVVAKVYDLANWIRGRIQRLEIAVIPRLRRLGLEGHNRVRIEIECAGGRKEVVLSDMQAGFLRKLGATGVATTLRRTKMDVLKAVPELRVWIENRERAPGADVANEATYGVNRSVQAAISLET